MPDRGVDGGDSIELPKRRRGDDTATPAVFVTVMAGEEDRLEGLRHGAHAYLVNDEASTCWTSEFTTAKKNTGTPVQGQGAVGAR